MNLSAVSLRAPLMPCHSRPREVRWLSPTFPGRGRGHQERKRAQCYEFSLCHYRPMVCPKKMPGSMPALHICQHDELIVTLTMNPAIDRTRSLWIGLPLTIAPTFFPAKTRPADARINAASVIHLVWREDAGDLSRRHGDRGGRFEHYMLDCGFPIATVPIQNDIRLNFTIVRPPRLDGEAQRTRPAPRAAASCRASKARSKRSWPSAAWLGCCAAACPPVFQRISTPRPDRSREERKASASLLDTDGRSPLPGRRSRPHRRNAESAGSGSGYSIPCCLLRSHSLAAARRIRSMGAESVVLSLGSSGSYRGRHHWQVWRISCSKPSCRAWKRSPPIGAGDALAAARLTWSLSNGDDFPEALSWSVATGTASAQLPGTQFATLEQAAEIHGDVDLRRVEGP